MKDLLKDHEKINKHYYEIGKLEGKREALLRIGVDDESTPAQKFEDFLMSIPFNGPNTQEILKELHEKISILLLNTTVEELNEPCLRILEDDFRL